MDERFEAFTVLISRINRSIKRLKAWEMSDLGLKGPHVSCLYYLSLGNMTASELCERCEEDKAAVSRTLDYLEENGYINCSDSRSKRYKSPLALTEKGKAACAEINGKIAFIEATAGEGIDDESRAKMYAALSKVSDNLEKICNETRAARSAAKSEEKK